MSELIGLRNSLNQHLLECSAANGRTVEQLRTLGEKVEELRQVVVWAIAGVLGTLTTLLIMLFHSKGFL